MSVHDVDWLENAFKDWKQTWEKPFGEMQKNVNFLVAERDEQEKIRNRGELGGAWKGSPPENRTQFSNALRNFLLGDKSALSQFAPQNAMTVGVDPGGGYTVFPQIEKGISSILRDVSPFRRVARIRPVSIGDAYEERYSLGGAGAAWVAEEEGRPVTTTPDLKVLRVPLHEQYSMPEASQKLLDDSSSDITGWLNGQVAIAFGESESAAFVVGTGVKQPRGVATYPTAATPDATRAWETLEHIASGNASAFNATEPEDALYNIVRALKVGYRTRAVWMMNRSTAGTVSLFKDSQLRPLWTESLQAGQPSTLLGFPVLLNEDFADVAANAFPIAFGDFSQGYAIVDRPGVRLLVDPFTNKPHVRLYTYRRVGGDVRDFNSLKLLKIATS